MCLCMRCNSSNHLAALLWVPHSGQTPGQHFRCWSPQENLACIAEDTYSVQVLSCDGHVTAIRVSCDSPSIPGRASTLMGRVALMVVLDTNRCVADDQTSTEIPAVSATAEHTE